MNTVASLESAAAVNIHCTDTGLFGLKVSGMEWGKKQLLDALIQELRRTIEPMTDEEFLRGKNILCSQILLNLERQADRMEEQVKNVNHFYELKLLTFGKLTAPQYIENIQSVTKKQLSDKMRELLHTKEPCVIYQGADIKDLPDKDRIIKMLRQ